MPKMQQEDKTQESQKDALKNDELPEGPLLNEPTPVADYSKENEQAQAKLAEFGETDMEQFIVKVTSNSIYARQVIRKMLGLDADTPFANAEHRTSPQENNLTGRLVHAQYPPKIAGGPSGQPDEEVK